MATPPESPNKNAASVATGSILGVIFKPFEYVWQAIPSSVQYFLLGVVLLLVVYPLVSFLCVIYLLPALPDRFRLPMQERALQSWGLDRDYSTRSELDRLNEAVDTSTGFVMMSDKIRTYTQYVVPGQRVVFRTKVEPIPKEGQSGECVIAVAPSPRTEIGQFNFSFDDNGWSKDARLTARERGPYRTTVIDRTGWSHVDDARPGEPLPLSITYEPTPQNTLYFQCFRYEVSVYIEVFKPELRNPAPPRVSSGAVKG